MTYDELLKIDQMISDILAKMPKPSTSKLAKQDQIFAALDDYLLKGKL